MAKKLSTTHRKSPISGQTSKGIDDAADDEALLRQVMNRARIYTWQYDVQSRKPIWTDGLYDLYGVDRNEQSDLVALFRSMIHPDDLQVWYATVSSVDEFNQSFQHRLIRPDGKILYLRQTVDRRTDREGTLISMAGTTQDITDIMESKLRAETSESRFRSLIQNGSDLIAIIDLQGTYKYLSENAQKLIGYDAQAMVGKNVFDFIHPDDEMACRNQIAAVAHSKWIEQESVRFRAGDGTWRCFDAKITNLLDDPAVKGIVVNARDITDKKAALDQIRTLSKIAEETVNAVVITDAEGRINWVNPAFARITGYSFSEAIGRKPGSLLQGPGSDRQTIAHMSGQLRAGQGFDVEILNYTKEKIPYWLSIQCQPQYNERREVMTFFAIQTDITERKTLQAQLNEEIRQRQNKVTAAIVNAQEKERNEIGNELHDNVNQILSTVKLYVGMARESAIQKEDLLAKSMTYLQDCIDEIRQISKRLSSPAKGKLNLEEAISDLVQSIAVAARIDFEFRPHHLDNCTLHEDIQLAIYRITQEHLTNILKHSGADQVLISLACVSDTINLEIVDNGQGFEMEKKRTGIGISNMFNRAQSIGGKVDIKSSNGKGCTLSGTFPVWVAC